MARQLSHLKNVRGEVRSLPSDASAEESVLGGVILRNEALAYLPDLEVEHFYDHRHKVVFAAMRELEAKGMPIDIVTIEGEIEKVGKLDAVGGPGFLGELALRCPTVDNVETYAGLVLKHAMTRNILLTLSEFIEIGYTREEEGEQLLHDLTSALMRVQTTREVPIVTMSKLIADEAARVAHDIERRQSGELLFAGVPSGVDVVDGKIGGHPIELMTLYIARPAMGKTTIAMLFGEASKRIGGLDTLLASYEDSGQSFGQRALGKESGVPTEVIRSRRLDDASLAEVMAVAANNARTESVISASGMSVESLARRVRRENMRRKNAGRPPFAQLVVDYLQKLPMPEWAKSRDEGVGHISATLCRLAVAEHMAVVAMCQLNRQSEQRDDHRPRLSDIRDSGALEQDGKLIIGLYHPATYDKAKYPEEEFHLIVLKNHQGENNGDIRMWWDRQRHAIYNSQMQYQAARMRAR